MSLLYKNTLKKILKSKGRFISLVLIVLVGVGFYAGIQITAPDINKVSQNYYSETKLFDLKINSTLGFHKETLLKLKEHESVEIVEPSYFADATYDKEVLRVHALSNTVNKVKIISGRLPQNSKEAVGDVSKFKLGEKILLDAYDETLINNSFTIVGLADSSLYIGDEYGSTHKGNGKLTSFIFATPSSFNTEYFSEVSIRLKNGPDLIKNGTYENIVDEVSKYIQSISDEHKLLQLDTIKNEARMEVDTKQSQLNESKASGQKEIDDALHTLNLNQIKLNEATNTLNTQQTKLNDITVSQTESLKQNQRVLDSKRYEIETTLKSLNLKESELDSSINKMSENITSLEAQIQLLNTESPEYTAALEDVEFLKVQRQGIETLKNGIAELNEAQLNLSEGLKTLNKETESGQAKIDSARFEIQKNQNDITQARITLSDNQIVLDDKISEAQILLDEAYAEIESIEKPSWYTFTRKTTGSYLELESSTAVISNIAKVFPIFFVLIALLMTSNSMSRMINEERSELGTLSSLGFSDLSIIMTYVLYASLVSIIGVLFGFFIGIFGIPPLIYSTFSNFKLPSLEYIVDYGVLSLALLVTLILMIGVSVRVSNMELKSNPSLLLRPLPPKQGKKTFLQNLPFIWNNLSFNWKVTLRNIFRYKKRALMTLVGVAGCTALLLVGFGLRDSMNGVERVQYSEIFKYQSMITLHDKQDDDLNALKSKLNSYGVSDFATLQQVPFKVVSESNPLDLYLIGFDNTQDYSQYYGLTSAINSDKLPLDNGVIISEKMADILHVGIGDSIVIQNRNFESYTLKISNISVNYISHYIYIDSFTYQEVFAKDLETNTIVTNFNFSENNQNIETMINDNFALNVLTSEEMSSAIRDTNKSLDGIVILIVGVASLLAFVVLYNLTSINISERKRELATLKVLGFSDSAANGYIYREALMLTLLSIGLGLIAGKGLHRYVVMVIEGTGMMFFKTIEIESYLFASIITLAISFIMQILTYQVIKRINMVEALKSNE